MEVLALLVVGVRAVAIALVASAGVVAATHWAVRRRHLNPFGVWSRTVRRLSDPVLRPIESAVMRRGGNPQDGTLWLVGAAVLAGLLLVLVTRWLLRFAFAISQLGSATPMGALRIILTTAIAVVMTSILIRVVASWIGVSPYSRFMRLVARLNEWIIAPIRRRVPPFGMIDVSPLLAYFALFLLREIVWSLLG